MNYKKAFYIILGIVALGVVYGVQSFYVHFDTSDYCHLEKRTDFIEREDGITVAEQNDYVVIDTTGYRNFIFPLSFTTLIPNPEGTLTCEGLKIEHTVER